MDIVNGPIPKISQASMIKENTAGYNIIPLFSGCSFKISLKNVEFCFTSSAGNRLYEIKWMLDLVLPL